MIRRSRHLSLADEVTPSSISTQCDRADQSKSQTTIRYQSSGFGFTSEVLAEGTTPSKEGERAIRGCRTFPMIRFTTQHCIRIEAAGSGLTEVEMVSTVGKSLWRD